jgi:CheY-like chemotaxis protein
MVVEDDPECLEAVGAALRFGGYAVVPAASGADALSRLLSRAPPPDVILLDLLLPGMDGAGLVGELRERPALARIPVVLLSGERDLARRAAELGVAGHVRKPVDLDDLLAAVRALVGAPA